LALYRSAFLTSLIECLYTGNSCLVFTHSKLSFKIPGAGVNWFPHQDNGYKFRTDLRSGFAIFMCLEDMDDGNGCLQIFPRSHKLGTLPHERVIEDASTGDNQLRIQSIPPTLSSRSVIGKKGDVIAFSCNTIHQSGSSHVQSKRLALIAEVEEYTSRKLDDYGKAPIPARGAYAKIDELLMHAKSVVTPYTIWRVVKKNRRLALWIRKLRH
jgi:ectoine hydroxylase-related dioxygenase (phytanoyl-CoA dioxygenase family)